VPGAVGDRSDAHGKNSNGNQREPEPRRGRSQTVPSPQPTLTVLVPGNFIHTYLSPWAVLDPGCDCDDVGQVDEPERMAHCPHPVALVLDLGDLAPEVARAK
jgi:hypothetical protein